MTVKPFEEQGHYVGVHDAVFDTLMPMCPPNSFKVLCFILRKTKGWSKETEAISYEALQKGTGISSRSTLSGSIKWLRRNNLIVVDDGGGSTVARYSLNRGFSLPSTETVPPSSTENGPVNKQRKETIKEATLPPTEPEYTPQQLLTKEFFDALAERYRVELEPSQYGYHVGKFGRAIEKKGATEAELSQALRYMVDRYPAHPTIDAVKAVEDVRLGRHDGSAWEGDKPWEKKSNLPPNERWKDGYYDDPRWEPTQADDEELTEEQLARSKKKQKEIMERLGINA